MNILIKLMILNACKLIMIKASEPDTSENDLINIEELKRKKENWTNHLFLEQTQQNFNGINETIETQIAKNVLFESLEYIAKHNQLYENGLHGHNLTPNHFLGLTNAELPKIKFKNFDDSTDESGHTFQSIYALPDEFDWRQLGKVTRAKDQAKCNCCYAFTVTATIESAVAIRDNLTVYVSQNNSTLDLSEQQIIDCSYGGNYQNKGCKYGYIEDTYQYVIDNGLVSQHNYPYKAEKNSCLEPIVGNRTFISQFKGISVQSVDQIKRIIMSNGPVIAPINNDGLDFLFYNHGIIRTAPNKTTKSGHFFNHAVVIVGWGQQNSTKYWIIKNSWSESWGENGFARIEFGVRGVDKYIYYPLLNDYSRTDIYSKILIYVFIVGAILMFASLIAILKFCCDRRGKVKAFRKFKA